MSDPAQATTEHAGDHATGPAPRDPARAPLLGLLRTLIAHGRTILAALQARNAPTPPIEIVRSFASYNLALIVARVTRGLMIAAALEARLLRAPPPKAQPAERAAPTEPRAKPRPRQPREDEEAELLGPLPSAREIAARIRKRPTGAVIVEICRDLGIDTTHPLWREIWKAIVFNGGQVLNMLNAVRRRWHNAPPIPLPAELEAHFDGMMVAFGQPP